jgi:hypothetical protein
MRIIEIALLSGKFHSFTHIRINSLDAKRAKRNRRCESRFLSINRILPDTLSVHLKAVTDAQASNSFGRFSPKKALFARQLPIRSVRDALSTTCSVVSVDSRLLHDYS